ncbi:MAG: efflux RND transporter periplasmic adaptor subunit [Cardiobacteriaceae bacterium]|nr:efflux RND transporter periplasmic adaptor subunit [Cardiobacteriaceae bacterium]
MKKRLTLLLFFFSHVGFAADNTPPSEAAPQAALTVSVVTAQTMSHEVSLEADGTIEAGEIAVVNAQVAGVALARLMADVGDTVKQGQTLALFDTALLKQELAQAQASVTQAQAALKQAKSNVSRVRTLIKERAISVSDSEQLVTSEREAQARLDGAVAARDMAQLRLDYAQVRAPADGIIITRPAELGMTAAIGLPLFTEIVDGALEWQAQVNPEQASRLKVGIPVNVRVGDNVIPGKIRKFAPVTDPQSRQLTVFVAMQPHNALRAGMLVRGAFLLGQENVQTLPVSSLIREDGYDYVMLVDKDNRVKRQALSLGERIADRVVVREGLPAGAQVVERSASFLQDGDTVQIAKE